MSGTPDPSTLESEWLFVLVFASAFALLFALAATFTLETSGIDTRFRIRLRLFEVFDGATTLVGTGVLETLCFMKSALSLIHI